MIELLIAALGVLFVGATGAVLRSHERSRAEIRSSTDALAEVLGGIGRGTDGDVQRRLLALEDGVDRLPQKWEEIKREAKSLYGRATHHVSRAREELHERGFADPEIEQLAGELQLVDVGGSRNEGMQPMHPGMAEVPSPIEAPEPTEDWRAITLRRKYGG